MTRREEQLELDKCRENNEAAAMERMDYEGGNQGEDCSDREQRLNNGEQTNYDTDSPSTGRNTPDRGARQEP